MPRRGFNERLFPMRAVAVGEMRVQIDQPRQQRRVAEVDEPGALRNFYLRAN
jgi:hypothetical protein